MTARLVTRAITTPIGPMMAGVIDPATDAVDDRADRPGDDHGAPALSLLEFVDRPRLAMELRQLERLLACRVEDEGEFDSVTPASELLDEAERQLGAYFAGRRREFDLPLRLPGTPFQTAVWAELRRIPPGETISYGELARRVGRPDAQRAVGAANGANRVSIVVPCHRVIDSQGKLHGYGGGLPRKKWLLDHESAGLFGSAPMNHAVTMHG